MKEIGGFFPLELRNQHEYYETDELQVKKYNSGRTAILMAISNSGADTVYLPVYLCPSVEEAVKKYGVQIKHYHINEKFCPVIKEEIKENEIVLWVNYYGMIEPNHIKKIVAAYKHLIIDNTQAFFSKPEKGAYNIYSCRKFFGVSDGAYLIGASLHNNQDMPYDTSFQTSSYLLKTYETGTNDNYSDSLKNEERIQSSGLLRMSKLTETILKSIDYEVISNKRMDNFLYLNNRLKIKNEFHFCASPEGPMIYPFLNQRNKSIRKKLIEHKVYVSQWWKAVLEHEDANTFECYLSEYLLPLPIDQRYAREDMEQIVQIILENW